VAGEPKTVAPDRLFLWMSELRHRPANQKWIVDGYLSRGGVTLLSAIWKAGKSTWLAHLIRSLGDGSATFCGRAVKPGRVLYVTEEDQETWAERRDALGLRDHIGVVCRPFVSRPNPSQWHAFISSVAAAAKEHAFDLVIFDTLSKLWCVREENDANQVEDALMPLWAITNGPEKGGAGAALLLVHHMRKSDGTEFTGGRGSGGLPAFAETLVELRRYDRNDKRDHRRVLTGAGRFRETPDELVVELTAAGFIPLGTKADVGGDDPEKAEKPLGEWAVGALPDSAPGLTVDEVNAAVRKVRGKGVGNKKLTDELNRLYEAGEADRSGEGKAGDPFRYFLP
jgi:hypothetical protein